MKSNDIDDIKIEIDKNYNENTYEDYDIGIQSVEGDLNIKKKNFKFEKILE